MGFAAETERAVEGAAAKLRRKGLDLVVANDVTRPGAGFGTDTNIVTLVRADGSAEDLPLMSKLDVARRIVAEIERLAANRPCAARSRAPAASMSIATDTPPGGGQAARAAPSRELSSAGRVPRSTSWKRHSPLALSTAAGTGAPSLHSALLPTAAAKRTAYSSVRVRSAPLTVTQSRWEKGG